MNMLQLVELSSREGKAMEELVNLPDGLSLAQAKAFTQHERNFWDYERQIKELHAKRAEMSKTAVVIVPALGSVEYVVGGGVYLPRHLKIK